MNIDLLLFNSLSASLKEPETTGAAPAGAPPKGPIDRAIDRFKAL